MPTNVGGVCTATDVDQIQLFLTATAVGEVFQVGLGCSSAAESALPSSGKVDNSRLVTPNSIGRQKHDTSNSVALVCTAD